MQRLLLTLLLLSNASAGTLCLHAQHLVITDSSKELRLVHALFLEDPDSTLTINDAIARQSDFLRPKNPVPDFQANLSRAVWFHFTVTNKTLERHWHFKVKGGYQHMFDLYEYLPDGQLSHQRAQGDGNFADKVIKSNDLVLPIPMEPGTRHSYFLRVTSRTIIHPSMSVGTMTTFYENDRRELYLNGFFSALAFAMLFYNLFLYASLRERVYLFYFFYILFYAVHNNFTLGYTLLFFPSSDWINTSWMLPLVGIFSILFTNSFLQAKTYAPFIYRIRGLMFALCVVPPPIYFAGHPQLAILLTSALMYILFVYWIAAGAIAYRNKFQPALPYLLAYVALVVCNVVFGLKMSGYIPENYVTDSLLFIGTALEAIILSYALAIKMNLYKKEKELIQEEALQQALEYSRTLISTQESERKRIASELHDSVGQKLIVIKNKVLLFCRSDFSGFRQKPENLAENVADAIQEVRSISYALRPYQMDLLGLSQSLRSLVDDIMDASGVEFRTDIESVDDCFEKDLQINVYRIVQECLNNVVKHARARSCFVSVKRNDDQVVINIADDGVGIDHDKAGVGFGLKGIRERLHILNGTIDIRGAVPQGTSVTICLPLRERSSEIVR